MQREREMKFATRSFSLSLLCPAFNVGTGKVRGGVTAPIILGSDNDIRRDCGREINDWVHDWVCPRFLSLSLQLFTSADHSKAGNFSFPYHLFLSLYDSWCPSSNTVIIQDTQKRKKRERERRLIYKTIDDDHDDYGYLETSILLQLILFPNSVRSFFFFPLR